MEEIIVTARRVEERLQDVPISITVFNQQQISDRNVTTASDLAAFTPSLSTDKRFGADNSTFSIRGFTQEIRTTPHRWVSISPMSSHPAVAALSRQRAMVPALALSSIYRMCRC